MCLCTATNTRKPRHYIVRQINPTLVVRARGRSDIIGLFPRFGAEMGSMKKQFLIATVLAMTAGPAMAAPWVRGFVVDNYEPAFYYGGRSGTEEPGTDCPKGTIPILDYKKELKTSWRTQAEIDKITLPVSAGGEGERGSVGIEGHRVDLCGAVDRAEAFGSPAPRRHAPQLVRLLRVHAKRGEQHVLTVS